MEVPSFLPWAPLIDFFGGRVIDECAWYNTGLFQSKNRKYSFCSTKAESGGRETQGSYMDPGRKKTARGERDRRKVGGGRTINNREGKMCEIIHPNLSL